MKIGAWQMVFNRKIQRIAFRINEIEHPDVFVVQIGLLGFKNGQKDET
jgi:hypothetical protein